MADYGAWTETDLEAHHAELGDEAGRIRDERVAISAELGRRQRTRELLRQAARLSDADLAEIQTIRATGIESAEAVMTDGGGVER